MKKHIAELDKQVTEIKEIEKKKQELLDRTKVIQELQGNRPVIVRVFDEIVRVLPDGVFYKKLIRKNNQISAEGTAESNNRISSLMRKVSNSQWFEQPNLTGVKANPDFGEQASDFELSFAISSPSDKKGDEE